MRILLILDGSTQAMDEALRLARERQGSLTALFVRDGTWREFTGNDWLSTSRSYTGFLEHMEGVEMDEAGRALAEFGARAADQGVEPELKLARGRISEEALNEAKQGYDIMVLANPLRRGLQSMRDALARIVKDAPCTVHLIRHSGPAPLGPSS